MKLLWHFIEKDLLPLWVLKAGVRYLCWERLAEQQAGGFEAESVKLQKFIENCRQSPIAVLTEKANEQHYEVPAEFYLKVLGRQLKYSSCYYPAAETTLDEAEERMLSLTVEHAEIADGMQILELGCGWGSLTLWMAAKFPKAKIVAVSNSNSQREFITKIAAERGLENITVATSDINELELAQKFDRVVSVEMFEHLRNHELLFNKISRWLNQDGKLFFHVFCHKKFAYLYESEGETNWMGRYFFSGGMMPSENLFLYYQKDLKIEKITRISGCHYSRTSYDWIKNLENHRSDLLPVLEKIYGRHQGLKWFVRWKLFFLGCAVLFGYNGGSEWYVAHYLYKK